MRLLSRYLLRQNAFMLLLICGIGLGVYVFIELFDRLDDFLAAGVPAATIGLYFLYRAPYLLSQIFPAVFLISLMVQFGVMHRNRELLALETCAVSPRSISKSIFFYALVLCLLQLLFSEVLAVRGYKAAGEIWAVQVRNHQLAVRQLTDVWFREGEYVVHLDSLTPAARQGQGLTIDRLDPGNAGRIVEIIRAEKFQALDEGWILTAVTRGQPDTFTVERLDSLRLPLRTDVRAFLAVDPKARLETLPLWQLGREITRLRDSGSNIERLQTAWHMKLAYAASVLVMALVALAAVTTFTSLFVVIPVGLVSTFCYYGLFVLFSAAGEKGLLPPVLAAWGVNAIFSVLAAARLLYAASFHPG